MTVLCATIAKTTACTQPLHFDAMQRLRQAFFALAQHLAQQYQGTLRFFGADGVLVLFGVTEAGADHAQQAVLAAMELQRRLRTPSADLGAVQLTATAVRMGLHTGAVAGDDLSGEQQAAATAMDDTMSLAVWLQYLAEPGTLLVSGATMQLLQGEVWYATRRDIHIPGQPHPVETYTVRASDS
jgi:adenylate cyclase